MPQIFCSNFAIFIMIYKQITSDVFNISNRIKSIDPKYYIVFNISRQKFEVHYRRAKNTYELTIPYNCLDARTINFVLKTQVKNKDSLLAEIELSNQKLQNRSVYENY